MTHAYLPKKSASNTTSSVLQQKCRCGNRTIAGNQCEACQRKPAARGRDTLSRGSYDAVERGTSSFGAPLDGSTRTFMEQRFREDFSAVRVHTGGQAAHSAEEMDAHAYTVGRDIVFGAGQYSPGTIAGQELLAHELAHTIQQSRGEATTSSSVGDLLQFETQADRIARTVVHGGAIESASPANVESGVQRSARSNAELLIPEEQQEGEVQDGDAVVEGLRPVPSRLELAAENDEHPVLNAAVQSKAKKHKVHTSLAPAPASREGKTIDRIDVDLSSQRLTISYSDGAHSEPIKISSGKGKKSVAGDPCANPQLDGSNCTPTGTFRPAGLGDADTTNSHGDAMSWFVKFDGVAGARGIGIHDSQPVTGRPASHGCIRIDSASARHINLHVTRETVINVSGKAPTGHKPRIETKRPLQKSAKTNAPLSFELSNAPAASDSQERVRLWLVQYKGDIAAAEKEFGVDRRAIAGAVAWEALENPKSFSLRAVGPGKVHLYDFYGASTWRAVKKLAGSTQDGKWRSPSTLFPVLSEMLVEGTAAEEVEHAGLVDKQDIPGRIKQLSEPKSAIRYIAAIMKQDSSIAKRGGVDIASDPPMLATFYNAWTFAEMKYFFLNEQSNRALSPNDEMGSWIQENLSFLESAVGKSEITNNGKSGE